MTIHHSSPCLHEEEWRRVKDVILSGQIAGGKEVAAFEEEMGGYLTLPAGVATSSGTAALHLALLALGVGPGDEVLLPSYVCSAPLHAVHYVRATPVFVDVDPETGILDTDDLRRRLTPRSKVIVAVHLFGMPADMERILSLEIPVLEDCAQALGATIGGRRVGSFGRMGITSFYATKLMTTGEGGMAFSSQASWTAKARELVEYDKREDFQVRFNYKMTDMEAAMGRCQLARLDTFLQKRAALARDYAAGLAHLPCRMPPASQGRVYYRYVVTILGRVESIIEKLREYGVEAARPIFRPLHTYFGMPGFPGADEAWSRHLSLPIHPNLSSEDVRRVCHALERALEEAEP